MTQEEVNEILKGWAPLYKPQDLKKCPICDEAYFGDGASPCVECINTNSDDGGVK